MKKLKSIVMETVRVAGATIFWAVTLPAAAVFFPLVALWQRAVLLPRNGRTGGTLPRTSPIGV